MSNPTFQHRHYAALADMLADARDGLACMADDTGKQHAADTISELEDRMVSMFMRDNAKFSASRFRKAATRAPDMHGKDKL
jgi:hypothetical protein